MEPRSGSGSGPNSLTPVTVALARSGKGLNRRRSRSWPARVVPPAMYQIFGNERTHRSPAREDCDITAAAAAAGPSSNSTNPGAAPKRTTSATLSTRDPGPETMRTSSSGGSLGIGLGMVIRESFDGREASKNAESRMSPLSSQVQYHTLPDAEAPTAGASGPTNSGPSG